MNLFFETSKFVKVQYWQMDKKKSATGRIIILVVMAITLLSWRHHIFFLPRAS